MEVRGWADLEAQGQARPLVGQDQVLISPVVTVHFTKQ